MADGRLPRADWDAFLARVSQSGLEFEDGPGSYQRLQELRSCYEPYLAGLALMLALPLTRWIAEPGAKDNWETSAWDGSHF